MPGVPFAGDRVQILLDSESFNLSVGAHAWQVAKKAQFLEMNRMHAILLWRMQW